MRLAPSLLRQSIAPAIFLLATFFASGARAEIYTIDFTVTSGAAPSSGSFTYDPIAQTFSAFDVTWNGLAMDFTAAATAFFFPGCGSVGGSAAFDVLSQNCPAIQDTSYDWYAAANSDGTGTFQFQGPTADGSVAVYPATFNGRATTAGGTWSLVSATPEPSSLAIGLTLLAALVLVARKLNFGANLQPLK